MSLQEITLESLNNFDCGKVAAAFNTQVKKVVADLRDRPGDKSKRTVALTMIVVPQPGQSGNCDSAMVSFIVTSKMPALSTRDYVVGVRVNDALVVNDASPDNVHQATLDQELDRHAEPAKPEPAQDGGAMSDDAQRRMEAS
jgi:hypothetical protein